MKWTKTIAYALAFLLVLNNFTFVANAAIYSDVPSWATDAVNQVSEEGLMVGNSNGEFEPYEEVTYFDLVDVLAIMAGYKDPVINPTITAEEKNYIENAYKVNKWVIDSYSSDKTKWQHSQDKKIAYLLQEGIVDQADLSLFVKGNGSSEQQGYVTKEALCKYLVRLLGLESEALSLNGNTDFADDSQIQDMYKPFVALLQDLGIISGGTDNKFNPKEEVTRVILAVFFNNVLDYLDEYGSNLPTTDDSQLQEVTGKVTEVYDYDGMKAVRISITDTNNILYKASDYVEIYKDEQKVSGSLSTFVKEYDTIKVMINDQNTIQKIYIGSYTTTTPGVTPTPQPPVDNGTVSYEEITGVIKNIDNTASGYKVTLNVQYVTLSEIKDVTKEYTLVSGAEVTENGSVVELSDVEIGAVATAKVHNGMMYSLDTLTKKHTVEGTVISKEMYEDKFIIKIEDEFGEVRTYNLNSDTDIDKKGIKNPNYNDISIGNDVVVEAEYDIVTDITCTTDYETYKGYIEKIEISKSPKISIKGEDGLVYNLTFSHDASLYDDDDGIDIYDLKLGYEVEVDVDGLEIYTLDLENKVYQDTIEGIILDVEDNGKKIVVKVKSDDVSGQYYLKTITVDGTKIYKNGNSISRSNLDEDMRVIITLEKDDNNEADVIYVFE